jgi:bacterioferritin
VCDRAKAGKGQCDSSHGLKLPTDAISRFHQREIIMSKKSDLSNVETLRRDARKHIEQGAVTADYSADRAALIEQLNQALATELVCVLRYRRHHFMARGIHARAVAAEFLAHSNEELGHADLLAARIVQLGGEPDFAPSDLSGRSHAEYVAGISLRDMIREDLVAERIAINSYRDMIRRLGENDPTTSDMLKGILAVEEEHADDLADLLEDFPHAQ